MPVLAATSLEFIRAALENTVDVLQQRLALWTAAVALGLLLEYGAELARISCDKLEKERKKRPAEHAHEDPQKRFKWISWFLVLGAVAVTVGVAGELFVEAEVGSAEARLRTFTNSRDLEQRKDIASAVERANEAVAREKASEAQIAVAGAKAAESNRKAFEANLELTRITSRRAIHKAVRLEEKLKRFSGMEYDFMAVAQDAESIDLLRSIDFLLSSSGWVLRVFETNETLSGTVLVRNGISARLGITQPGIHLFAPGPRPAGDNACWAAASGLADALMSKDGLDRAQFGGRELIVSLLSLTVTSGQAQRVHILVGQKL